MARRWLSVLLIVVVLAGVYRLGYVSGRQGFALSTKDFKVINTQNPTTTVDYGLLWDALRVVSGKYIEKDGIDQQKVLYGAIRGAVAAAGDEYTTFFDPKDLADFQTELKGSFEGIGAEVAKRDGNIVVVAPIDDGPAAKAGVKAKDIILKVNGDSISELSVEAAVSKIRGAKGTQVTLELYREGKDKPFSVTITRDVIAVKSVKLEYKTVQGQQVAYLTLSRFGDDTEDLFDKAVKDITSKGVKRLVVDVRNNPGGYLDAAVQLASEWVPKDKLVVKEAHSDKDATLLNSFGYGRLADVKTVILTNGGSASAAEILTGALHDYKLATTVGEKTFGKGSVQELVPLTGGSAVKVTVAKWITPNGVNLHKDGLVPDVEVKISDDDAAKDKDPQLDKALELVVQ
jgi:carboxyl-terminal processing protease